MNPVWYLNKYFESRKIFGLKVQVLEFRDQSVIILKYFNVIKIVKEGFYPIG